MRAGSESRLAAMGAPPPPAGGLIAEEAGAVVTDIRGDPDYLAPPQSVLAANPCIHPQMLEVLRGHK